MTDVTVAALPAPRSIWSLRFEKFRGHRLAMYSLVFLAVLTAICLMAWPLSQYLGIDPNKTNLLARFKAPNAQHWLGTDDLGRDVLIRLMYGGQVSIAVGLLATFLMTVLGVAVGVTAGFLGGRTDAVLMRLTDCMIALPLIPLLIVLGAVDLTKLGLSAASAGSPLFIFLRIVIIIALVDWTTMARIARAGAIQVRDRDYVRAATVAGAKRRYNVLVHVLPNISTPLIVAATLTVGRVILLESTLSFLGFGIVPPTPTWGNMLTNAQQLIISAPHLAVYPGLLIFATVMAVNFVGDGVRYAFDPRAENEGRSH
ncbi:ABC transporter permease [Paracoccus litorisediminis]|uniref:ABC transporter permease subunit n=1 Tax=Paracoccus litorisediminis TaxID=2006130 RepID=A0A844HTJ4_9RHOB|nr:ABC transporter permease [Paracoccus litorisediminis]MTH61535.1 ABC transporter permease subunit [Paracoccus litorisediminis]